MGLDVWVSVDGFCVESFRSTVREGFQSVWCLEKMDVFRR